MGNVPAMLAALRRRPAGGGGVGSSACPDAPATPAAFTSFVTQLPSEAPDVIAASFGALIGDPAPTGPNTWAAVDDADPETSITGIVVTPQVDWGAGCAPGVLAARLQMAGTVSIPDAAGVMVMVGGVAQEMVPASGTDVVVDLVLSAWQWAQGVTLVYGWTADPESAGFPGTATIDSFEVTLDHDGNCCSTFVPAPPLPKLLASNDFIVAASPPESDFNAQSEFLERVVDVEEVVSVAWAGPSNSGTAGLDGGWTITWDTTPIAGRGAEITDLTLHFRTQAVGEGDSGNDTYVQLDFLLNGVATNLYTGVLGHDGSALPPANGITLVTGDLGLTITVPTGGAEITQAELRCAITNLSAVGSDGMQHNATIDIVPA